MSCSVVLLVTGCCLCSCTTGIYFGIPCHGLYESDEDAPFLGANVNDELCFLRIFLRRLHPVFFFLRALFDAISKFSALRVRTSWFLIGRGTSTLHAPQLQGRGLIYIRATCSMIRRVRYQSSRATSTLFFASDAYVGRYRPLSTESMIQYATAVAKLLLIVWS